MSPLIALALAGTVLSTSFISGIFGMAGGMILMGILLAIMPVAAAMVLHGITQAASNGWRAWLWHHHIQWPIVGRFAAGAAMAATVFTLAAFTPSKPIVFIILGLTPMIGLLMPAAVAPDIGRGWQGMLCGAICTGLQFLAGVSGPILDVFFVRSVLDRKALIATKAAIQVIGHVLKVGYFGVVLAEGTQELGLLVIVASVALTFLGTQLSRRVLDALSDAQFRSWSRHLITAISLVYLTQGLLLAFPTPASAVGVAFDHFFS